MTDLAEPPLKGPPSGDLQRLLFWGALTVSAVGAGVAIAAGEAAGRAGAILLIAIAAAALVFFVWMSRGSGRLVGLFPSRGAAEAAEAGIEQAEFAWLEALDEPAMVADRAGGPLAANAAYTRLVSTAGALGESERPPHVDRLFGADPLISPALFRLARAAANRQVRRESLPPTQWGAQEVMRLDVVVSPLEGRRVLWRLRPQSTEPAGRDETLPALFIDESPFGFLALDRDGVIVFANRSVRDALGGGADWPTGAAFADVIADDASLRSILKQRPPGEGVNVTLRTITGEARSAFAQSVRVSDDAGDLWRIFLDFSAIDRGAPNSRVSATPSASVMGTSGEEGADVAGDDFFARAPFGAAVLDGASLADAMILDANEALMDLSSGRAAPGARFTDLFEVADGPAALVQRLQMAWRRPVEITMAGDGAVTAHVQLAEAGGGRVLAYVINVSEQRELQQRLAQAEKMREIGLLAGGVAHDFNNLLTVVMMNCDYLLRRHPVGDPDFQDLSEINLHALRAKELSEMLRAYARQQTFKRELIEPTAFFAGVQELVRRLVGETVTFELRHGRDLPFVKVDKTQLERVVVNLASNARDAMTGKDSAIPRDGRLTIRTSRTTGAEARGLGHTPIEDGDYLLIEVVDTGCGIKPEDQARIFRPFHSTKEAGRGTGLGLATSYGIIKQHEGYIFFDSRVGVGTTFRIYLRAHEPSAEEVAERARVDEDSKTRRLHDVAGRGRILLVEDELGVRKAIARNLAECGYDVDQAEDGEEGLDKLRAASTRYDLIISDVSMPIMKGPEMLEAAGAELIGQTPVLFLSGFAPEEFAQVLEKYPVSYMAKPVGFADLAKRVKELIVS